MSTFLEIISVLGGPGLFAPWYRNEAEFEEDVWAKLRGWCKETHTGWSVDKVLLTSHKEHRDGRSEQEWQGFIDAADGPDVRLMAGNHRVDIVVRPPNEGTIGIEIKALSSNQKYRHEQLLKGLGQATLSLANREFALLIVHGGPLDKKERQNLRQIAKRITHNSRIGFLVVPNP
jgi:hypothetical protein